MIHIGIDPAIFHLGSFQLTWHGLFTFLGVATAVVLVARWARREGMNPDIVYNTAIWAIIAGIIGARLVHVVDNWGYYGANPVQIFVITAGGVGLWGGLLGGFLGGLIAARVMGYPIRTLMDLTAPALLVAQAVGRVGDIINGEHCSRFTTMPWGTVYTHPESPAFACPSVPSGAAETPAFHPAVGYELIFDLVVFGFLWYVVRGRLRPDGMLFALYLALYATGRMVIQTLFRVEFNPSFLFGLEEAQVIAILVLIVTVPLLLWKGRWGQRSLASATAASWWPRQSRAERRRRKRR